MPTDPIPLPEPSAPDTTVAIPQTDAPIVVAGAVVGFEGAANYIELGSDPADLGIGEGWSVAGRFIQPGTKVTELLSAGVNVDLATEDTSDGSDLKFTPPADTTEDIPSGVTPSNPVPATPPTPGHMAVWGENGSLADGGAVPEGGGAAGALHLDLGELAPTGYFEFMGFSEVGFDYVNNGTATGGTVAGISVVGWYVLSPSFPPGTTVLSAEDEQIILSAAATETGAFTMALSQAPEATIIVADLAPDYDPTAGRDLLITGRISPATWKFSAQPEIFLCLPTPPADGIAGNRVTVKIQVGDAPYAGASANLDLYLLHGTIEGMEVIGGPRTLRDTASLIPAQFQTVEYVLAPIAYNYEVLVDALPLAYVPSRGAAVVMATGGAVTGSVQGSHTGAIRLELFSSGWSPGSDPVESARITLTPATPWPGTPTWSLIPLPQEGNEDIPGIRYRIVSLSSTALVVEPEESLTAGFAGYFALLLIPHFPAA